MDVPTRKPEDLDVPVSEVIPAKKKWGTLLFGMVPAVPVLILVIWLLLWFLLANGYITKPVCTFGILATVAWFLVWLFRASRRG